MSSNAPKSPDTKKSETGDVREHFEREHPQNGEPGEPYGDETEAKDERRTPHTDHGKGLGNDRYGKSDSNQPKVSKNTAV
ncbi:hypothetical protein [Asticcacaulis sp. YBE204]|uniref:hypothetical protein n=1 Tax=Asticcacaulis sp. YBE204 TaxID=1282363 RepID=UPI0003C3BFAF|nr:hypothetical protein [Asticcacaulis sp. YBE204]ESQ79998.1 hypothetical protein AEYBE204_09115 [Asticcacaulis sp. YBE204]